MAESIHEATVDVEMNTANQFEHLLVIRLSAMGDVAMTVPVLSALTRQYPSLKITVLTKPFFTPMFAQLENVSVFEADVKGKHKGVFGLWTLYKAFRNQNIKAVADLHNVLRSNVLKYYFKSGGISFFQVDKARAEKKALTSADNKVFKPLKTTYERYADVFRASGYPIDLSAAAPLSKEQLSKKTLNWLLENSDKAAKLLIENSRENPKPPNDDLLKIIGIAPFAAFAGKSYPIHLLEKVLDQLNKTNRYSIIFFGGGHQEKKKLDTLAGPFESCINSAGKLSFTEELALISNLDVMLSMDSGNGHLAAMYGIPVVSLWGVTHPHAGFYPFGQDPKNALLADRKKFPLIPTSIYGNKMPKGYEKAIETISPNAVFAKLMEVLNEK